MLGTHVALIAAAAALVSVPSALAQEHEDTLVVLETAMGDITIELFPGDAPGHVENFVSLADSGFYDGVVFHRIIPGFMIQTGDPNSIDGDPATWGTGDPGYSIDAEFNDIMHVRGIVSMARSADPDSAGSQFFIVHDRAAHLDESYTAFGRIVTQESYDTLDAIADVEKSPGSDRPADAESVRVIDARTIARADAAGLLEQGPVARVGGADDADEPQPDDETGAADPDDDAAPALEINENLVGGVYTNKKLDVSFEPPANWAISEPQKTGPEIPDIAIVGAPTDARFPPNMTLSINYSAGRTLAEYRADSTAVYEEAIAAGVLEIEPDEQVEYAGLPGYAFEAVGQIAGSDHRFREVTLEGPEKFYTFTYVNAAEDFADHAERFEELLGSFSIPSEARADAGDGDGGGCLIATAAYGTEMAADVQRLREVRDGVLLSTASGTAFMAAFNDVYYSFSPAVADLERSSPLARDAARAMLAPLIATLPAMSLAPEGSEAGVLLLGSAVIALNAGIYAAAPAFAVRHALRLARRNA